MDRNSIRRKRYLEMPPHLKDALLRRRRDAYAAKKSRLLPSVSACGHQPVVASQGSLPLPLDANLLIPVPSGQHSHGAPVVSHVVQLCDTSASVPTRPASSSATLPDAASVSGQSANRKRRAPSRLQKIAAETLLLPSGPDCHHCGAKRFHLEPPNFCCSGGEVALVGTSMPYDLMRLFTGDDEECEHFRRNVRTYNNNVAFTTFATKYDRELTKNHFGVYTFRLQGQVYHFLNSLVSPGDTAFGIQLYFFDIDSELAQRVGGSPKLRESTLRLLMRVLSDNPYARFLRNLRSVPDLDRHKIILNCNPTLDQRVYNLPSASQVAAIWTETDVVDDTHDRSAHIQVYSHSDTGYTIKHYYACYDSLQYPLLFSHGESGWCHGIQRTQVRPAPQNRGSSGNDTVIDPSSVTTATLGKEEKSTVTAREYYCYKLQMRDGDRSMLLHALRLLQQYSVDVYVKIKTSRLDFHRKKQKELRTEALKGVLDSVSAGDVSGSKVGRRVILPASFIGGPRDMRRRYLDAMALVQKYGKLDIF
ncbi:uncharacterized protein LOC113773690 [Coffea eugenioides]|uniref:uncharacterized protein LOC113773690 n=1 Tax=Coffea eugenioides TaxID=49369 RepID=UPI000F615D30|nr:uncharacterized protein LOC113773690 [Coffea eugenioides]